MMKPGRSVARDVVAVALNLNTLLLLLLVEQPLMLQDALTVVETNCSLSIIFDVLGLFRGVKERIHFVRSLIWCLLVLLGDRAHFHAEDENTSVAQAV